MSELSDPVAGQIAGVFVLWEITYTGNLCKFFPVPRFICFVSADVLLLNATARAGLDFGLVLGDFELDLDADRVIAGAPSLTNKMKRVN